jgi:hypothetical protein
VPKITGKGWESKIGIPTQGIKLKIRKIKPNNFDRYFIYVLQDFLSFL